MSGGSESAAPDASHTRYLACISSLRLPIATRHCIHWQPSQQPTNHPTTIYCFFQQQPPSPPQAQTLYNSRFAPFLQPQPLQPNHCLTYGQYWAVSTECFEGYDGGCWGVFLASLCILILCLMSHDVPSSSSCESSLVLRNTTQEIQYVKFEVKSIIIMIITITQLKLYM